MRRIATAACIAAASMASGALQAQALYICASSTGHSYQQTACGPSSRLVGTLVTTPEPPPTAAALAERASRAQEDRAESAFLSHLAGTDQLLVARRSATRHGRPSRARSDHREDACRSARADRTRVLRTVGLGRTIDLLRSLDAAVWTACNR